MKRAPMKIHYEMNWHEGCLTLSSTLCHPVPLCRERLLREKPVHQPQLCRSLSTILMDHYTKSRELEQAKDSQKHWSGGHGLDLGMRTCAPLQIHEIHEKSPYSEAWD